MTKQPRAKDEYWTQRSIIQFLTSLPQLPEYEPLMWTHHIPNGGSRHPREAANLKLLGVLAGVADLCNPLSGVNHKGVYLEIKAPTKRNTKGKLVYAVTSSEQKQFLERMSRDGWRTEIVTDWVVGIRILFDHFGIPYPRVLGNAILYADRGSML